jgi:hypothetical protein
MDDVTTLRGMIERAVRAVDWEPGDVQRALRALQDEYVKWAVERDDKRFCTAAQPCERCLAHLRNLGYGAYDDFAEVQAAVHERETNVP